MLKFSHIKKIVLIRQLFNCQLIRTNAYGIRGAPSSSDERGGGGTLKFTTVIIPNFEGGVCADPFQRHILK